MCRCRRQYKLFEVPHIPPCPHPPPPPPAPPCHTHVLQLLHSGRQTQRLHSLVARRVWLDMHVKNSDGPQQLPYPHTPSGVQCMRIMWLVTTARPFLFIQCVISLSLASIAAPPLIVSRVTGFRLSIGLHCPGIVLVSSLF